LKLTNLEFYLVSEKPNLSI